MCKLKSAIILKDRVFIPDYNHHSQMLEELGIEDSIKNAEKIFVRAELSPKDGDVFSPIDTWIFTVDQDVRPDWFVESYEKERMVAAVKEWARDRIHIGIDGLKINSGSNHYIKDCKDVDISGSASISYVYGSASINRVCGSASISYVCGSASISYVYNSASISEVCDLASINRVCGSASIGVVCGSASIGVVYDLASIDRVCGSASISEVYDLASINRVCDSASISEVCGSASINEIYGSASINEIYDSAVVSSSRWFDWENKDKIIISDNATFKDNKAKILYQSGDWEVRLVGKED